MPSLLRCRPANEEFQIVAQSYRYSSAFSNRVFFAMVDFDEGSDIFQYVRTSRPNSPDHFSGALAQIEFGTSFRSFSTKNETEEKRFYGYQSVRLDPSKKSVFFVLNVDNGFRTGFSAEAIAKWINDRTDVQVNRLV